MVSLPRPRELKLGRFSVKIIPYLIKHRSIINKQHFPPSIDPYRSLKILQHQVHKVGFPLFHKEIEYHQIQTHSNLSPEVQ